MGFGLGLIVDFGLGPKTNKHEAGLEKHLLCAVQHCGGRR